MTRPCECGLGLRPRRLFGFAVEPVDGAPCFFSGSTALGGCGLPSTDSLCRLLSWPAMARRGGWLRRYPNRNAGFRFSANAAIPSR